MTQILVPLAVLGSGLAAGGSALSVLGGAPLMLHLPPERYVPVHQFLERRMHPFMPACMLVALACDIASAVLIGHQARILFGAAAALLAAAIIVSLLKNVPINRWVSTLDPGHLPADWARVDPRARWSEWNRVRSGCMVLALVANVVGIGALLPTT
jgi:uncharacterized membrane protein